MTARFSNAPYGPVHLRRLLRARMDPGERLVGFAVGQLSPSPLRVMTQVVLALIPGVGQIAAVAHGMLSQTQRRIVVLTSRRILLLKPDRSGPDPTGRGIAAELPLSLLSVSCTPAPAVAPRPAPAARGRLRRARRRRATRAEIAASVTTFSLVDLRSGGRVELVLPRAGPGAGARLREALVLLAENPAPGDPYNGGNAGPPRHRRARSSHTPRPRDGILREAGSTSQRTASPTTHPGADRRRIQE